MNTASASTGLGLLLTSGTASAPNALSESLQVLVPSAENGLVFSQVLSDQQQAGLVLTGLPSTPIAAPVGPGLRMWAVDADGNPLPLDSQRLPVLPGAPTTDSEQPVLDDTALAEQAEGVPLLATAEAPQSQQSTPTSGAQPGQVVVGAANPPQPASTSSAPVATDAGVTEVQMPVSTAASNRSASPGFSHGGHPGEPDPVTAPTPAVPAATAASGTAAAQNPASQVPVLGPGLNEQVVQQSSRIALESAAESIAAPAATPRTTSASTSQAQTTPTSFSQAYAAASSQDGGALSLQRPGWGEAVVEKVMWMSARQLGSAEIQVDPPELGPLQMRVTTQQDQTSVVFTSHHAAVRDALDGALPRLRDMLESQGLQLVNVDVSGQDASGRQGFAAESGSGSGAGDGSTDGSLADAEAADSLAPVLRRGLVDDYA